MSILCFLFVFKTENYILNGSHLSLFHKKHRDLTFPWCQCGSQKLSVPVCVLHGTVGSLDITEGPWFFFFLLFLVVPCDLQDFSSLTRD